jgi:uncharacterized protein (UPF0332 family)
LIKRNKRKNVTEEEARDLLETAQNFVQKLKNYLERWTEGKK